MALTTRKGAPITTPLRRSRLVHRRRWARYNLLTFYLFISPWMLGFILLTLFPLIYALVVSFTNFDGLSGHWKFIGLQNYIELFHDPVMWNSLARTILLTMIVVPASLVGGVGLALLVNQRLKAIGLFRTLFYLPSVVPVVAAAIMWRFVFDSGNGPVDAVITSFHGPLIQWLLDPDAFLALIIVILWGVGSSMIISLAGLQGIPAELHEAAKIDGSTGWQEFWKVTLPLLSPVLFFQIVTGVIAIQQVLVQPLLLSTSVGAYGYVVPKSNLLYMVNVYLTFFVNQRFGYGSALLWILFVLVIVATLLLFRFSRFWVYYEVETEEGV